MTTVGSPVHVRSARPFDAGAMAELLNAMGGTATSGALGDWMRDGDVWHLAEDAAGRATGLQWIGPGPDLPRRTCDIATFVPNGPLGLPIGAALFDATRNAARSHGYAWIRAAVDSGNAGGIAYYRSRGFEPTGAAAGSVVAMYRL